MKKNVALSFYFYYYSLHFITFFFPSKQFSKITLIFFLEIFFFSLSLLLPHKAILA